MVIGQRLGAHEIVAKLGEGGMGEVYRARDSRLNREVALKVLPTSAAGDAERRERFAREAQAVGWSRLPSPSCTSRGHPTAAEGRDYT
jgi:serine/threonine protein kinase